ncbi:MAG: ice-binding family protein [Nitrospirota bacterium]
MKHQTVRSHTFTRFTARLVAIALFAALLSAAPFHAAFAQTAPDLGSAGSFAVLAGPAVTCTDSTINGDVGSGLTGSAITQTNCTVNGTVHQGDATAMAAYNDFLSAYDALALVQCDQYLTGTLAGVTLAPGVYCFDAAATLTGQLTLDGPANGVWIFKIGTSGTGALTGTNFSVVMSGGGQACNVYWWVAEAATMTTSNFQGTILAGMATTFTGGSLIGRDLAKAAATLTGVTVSACSPGTPPMVCKDFVTGGGWIMLPSGSKGTFGVTGGIKHGKLRGHLTYVDHGSKGSKVKDMKVKGTGVTAYTVVDATTRHIEGTAEINGEAGYTYQVDVKDSGEPGRDDMFSLRLSNNYTASGNLAGGNIQLHKKCRPLICLPSDKDDADE